MPHPARRARSEPSTSPCRSRDAAQVRAATCAGAAGRIRGKEERVAPSRPAHSIPFASLLSAMCECRRESEKKASTLDGYP